MADNTQDNNEQPQDPQQPQEHSVLENVGDAARGAWQGATMGFGENISAGVKSFAKGTSYDDELKSEQEANEEAWQKNPAAYGAGYAGGTVGSMFVGVGEVAGAARAAGAVGKGVLKTASKILPEAKSAGKLAEGAAGAGKSALSFLKSSANAVTGKIAAGAKAVQGATSSAVSAGKELFKAPIAKITKTIDEAKSGFKAGNELHKAENLGGAGISKIESLAINAGQKFGRAKDFVTGKATQAIERTKELGTGVKNVFKSGMEKVKAVGSKAWEGAKTFGGKVTGAISKFAKPLLNTVKAVGGAAKRVVGSVARGIVNAGMFLGGGGGGTSGGTSRGGHGSLSAGGGGVPISAISGGDNGMVGAGSFGGEGGVGSKTALDALNKIHSTLMQIKSTNERMANDMSLLVKQSAQKDVAGDLNSANLMARSGGGGGGGFIPSSGYSGGGESGGTSGGGGGEMATPTAEIPKPEASTASKAGSWLGNVVSGGASLFKKVLGVAAPVAAIGLAGMPSILDKGVGAVSEKYESGGRGAGTISSGKGDAGGASYGTHQLSSAKGTLQTFLKSSEYGSQFAGLTPGSPEFNAKWKEVAKSDPKFGEAQQGFIQKTHFDPQMKKLQKGGVDLSGKGRAVQEAVWSTSVQFGGGTSLIQKALAGKDAKTMSDSEIVSAVQDYKVEHNEQLFKSSSANQRAGTLKRASQEKADLLKVAEMPQTWVGEKPSTKEPGLKSFQEKSSSKEEKSTKEQISNIETEKEKLRSSMFNEKGIMKEQSPELEKTQTQIQNLITQKYNILQSEKDKSSTKIIPESEINKPQLIGEVNQKEEPLGEKPTDAMGAQMWDIRKAEMEGKTNQPEPLGEKPTDAFGAQMWDIRKAEMEGKSHAPWIDNRENPTNTSVDNIAFKNGNIEIGEMTGGPSATPIFDESGSSLPSINETASEIPSVENDITSGLKGVTDIFSNVGTLISGAVGSIGGGDKKQAPSVVQAPAPDSAGHGGNMMSVRNDDPLLLTLQYGNLRTV